VERIAFTQKNPEEKINLSKGGKGSPWVKRGPHPGKGSEKKSEVRFSSDIN